MLRQYREPIYRGDPHLRTQTVLDKRGRDRLSIAAEILYITLDGSLKTQIMYKANLSFAHLSSYLSLLLECKLVEKIETEEKTVFKATPKGIWFLKAYRDVNRLLSTESVEEAIGKPSIVAAIPAYNEEKTIAKVILSTQSYVDRVIVCDDGSTDMTGEIAKRLGADVIQHEKTQGYGAAIQSLFGRARELNADVMVTLDADGGYDPNEIPELIVPILEGQADVAIGSRFLEREQTKDIPTHKRGIKAITRLVNVASGVGVRDAQSGLRAFGREALKGLTLSEDGMGVSIEMLLDARKKGLNIVEIPIGCKYQGLQTSTYSPLRHGLDAGASILKLMSRRLRKKTSMKER